MVSQKNKLPLMVSYFFLIAGLSMTFPGVALGRMSQKDVVVRRSGDTVTIENSSVRVEYNLSKGQYSAIDKRDTAKRRPTGGALRPNRRNPVEIAAA